MKYRIRERNDGKYLIFEKNEKMFCAWFCSSWNLSDFGVFDSEKAAKKCLDSILHKERQHEQPSFKR